MTSKTINLHMNRVEGDLEVSARVLDGVVVDAWCRGTMYRGFERIMMGRGALDGLVITPRICGICSTSHLMAAARALDSIAHVTPPPDAQRVRNLALMTEHVQSDVRHTVLMFAGDLVNPAHRDDPHYEEAVRRFEPFEGSSVREVIRETKKLLEVVAIIGGQWPHSSFMIPGGIASVPSRADLLQCALLVRSFRAWYEERILGCSIDRFAEVRSAGDLDAWLEESKSHAESDLGFFIRCARSMKLDRIGAGYDNFISYGSLELPPETSVRATEASLFLEPGGFARGTEVESFDQQDIAEHVAHSWFTDYEGGRHPFDGETRPYATGYEGSKYSWAKAPRYKDQPAETGPLAEAVVGGNHLIQDMIGRHGASVFVRQLARIIRPVRLLPAMEVWIKETRGDGEFYEKPREIENGRGFGLCHAGRGVLGHWVDVADGAIAHYQIITPTAWNASPRDAQDQRGPIEEALVGTAVADLDNPVDIFHVVRSFDPCLVCTVHALHGDRRRSTSCLRLGS
ncbi:MAG: nickel-dependent hydrogenase large subunit [Myxococcota bacterium]